MKKLYRKGTVHPSPPIISDHLSFLPATILTLTVALSPEDREVLAYLISCSNNSSNNFHGPKRNTNNHNHKSTTSSCTDHHPLFNCDCFGCYMSYWVRWDLSPNRQLIHEIIDAFEDWLFQNKKMKSKKERRNNSNNKKGCNKNNDGSVSELSLGKEKLSESGSVEETTSSGGGEEGTEKGSVRKLVSFIGERIWGGVWY